MLKIKIMSVAFAAAMVIGVFAGCGASQKAGGTGKLVDGVYKVEYDNFDSHDYKAQLELTVSGGKITDVKFDEIGKDGKFKSQDEQYKKKMEEASKTYPAKAYDELKKQLLSKQSAAVDTVSGATASSTSFKGLVKYAIGDMAAKGKNAPAKIPAPK